MLCFILDASAAIGYSAGTMRPANQVHPRASVRVAGARNGWRVAARALILVRMGRFTIRYRAAWPLLLLSSTAVQAATLQPGRYTLTSYLLLPHLEQMRQTIRVSERCLGENTWSELFPVLAEPALSGCHVAAVAAGHALRCAGDASGSAHIVVDGDDVHATLRVKLGGKNMTFEQHVLARRTSACEPAR